VKLGFPWFFLVGVGFVWFLLGFSWWARFLAVCPFSAGFTVPFGFGPSFYPTWNPFLLRFQTGPNVKLFALRVGFATNAVDVNELPCEFRDELGAETFAAFGAGLAGDRPSLRMKLRLKLDQNFGPS
jgi:hypothetical protein